jgi:putative addiction module component (TIGR02574 family)
MARAFAVAGSSISCLARNDPSGTIHSLNEDAAMSVTTIYDAALALSDDERADLVDRLLASLPSDVPTQLHPAWKAVLNQRSAELDSGAVKPIPWDEVRRSAWEDIDGPKHG